MNEEEKQKWEEFLQKNLDLKIGLGRYIHSIGQEIKYGTCDWPKITIPDEEAIEVFEKFYPKITIEIDGRKFEIK